MMAQFVRAPFVSSADQSLDRLRMDVVVMGPGQATFDTRISRMNSFGSTACRSPSGILRRCSTGGRPAPAL
jgi:hypothetical protein